MESAPLTPFHLTQGHSPLAAGEIVIGAGLAASSDLRVGSAVRMVGEPLPAFRVVGVATTTGDNPAENWTVFFSNAEAASLYGHPGQADLIESSCDRGCPLPRSPPVCDPSSAIRT